MAGDGELTLVVRRATPGAMLDIESLYDAVADDLYGFAISATRDPAVAEELMQEAFLRLIAVCRHGIAPSDPRAWLFTVCANLIRSRGRRLAVFGRWLQRLGPVGHDTADQAEPAEDTVVRAERDDELHRELARLPAEQRLALLLAAEGVAGREIADALGRSEGSTRTLLWRARLELRSRMERTEAR